MSTGSSLKCFASANLDSAVRSAVALKRSYLALQSRLFPVLMQKVSSPTLK